MQFRLTYEGPLLSDGRADHKHEIRKHFHHQLRRLWQTYPGMKQWGESRYTWQTFGGPEFSGEKSRIEVIANSYKRFGYEFVPLAANFRAAARDPPIVSLDILFLRNGGPGSVIKSADIDGRLKTLFDALRMPSQRGEVGSSPTPSPDETPFFVLMEDDRYVGNVSVTTDALLEPTPTSSGLLDKHDARLVIAVTLKNASEGQGIWP
jgi:hypothetical protein